MDVYVTFNQNQAKYTDNLNPSTSRNKRFKLDVKGVTTEPKLLIEDLKEIKDR